MGAAAMADVAAGRMTADILARAVIAAARVYGDDPVRALTAQGYGIRRSLPAAASAVARALRIELRPVCDVLGQPYESTRTARGKKRKLFAAAEAAAMRAVSYAGWRPEAAASVVAAREAGARVLSDNPRKRTDYYPTPRSAVRDLSPAEVTEAQARERARAARAAGKPVPWEVGEVSLSDRILQALAEMPASPTALAIRLDVKEAPVTGCIRELARQGRIAPEAMPETGPRYQKWVRA